MTRFIIVDNTGELLEASCGIPCRGQIFSPNIFSCSPLFESRELAEEARKYFEEYDQSEVCSEIKYEIKEINFA